MAEMNNFKIPPDKFDEYLKKNASTTKIVYDTNKELFEQAEKDGKIKIVSYTTRITDVHKIVSETNSYEWIRVNI